MFSHRIEIDGVDIWTDYGVYVANKGRFGLLQYPPLKQVYTQEWAEEDGLDCDLSNPVLDSKEFDIKLAIDDRPPAGADRAPMCFDDFEEDFLDGKYHDWYFADLQRFYRLRYVSQSSIKFIKNGWTDGGGNDRIKYTGMLFTVKMADDFPLFQYAYQAPNITEAFWKRFENIDAVSKIDRMFLYQYGALAIDGSLLEIFKSADMKTTLIRDLKEVSGRQMLSQFGKHKGRQAKVNLLMQAPNLQDLLRSYNALLYNIASPGEHTLTLKLDTQPIMHYVYYKNAQVKNFCADGIPSIIFSITFQVID